MLRTASLALVFAMVAPPLAAQQEFTRADTLRGDWTTPGRSWWDATWYDLSVRVSPDDSTLTGSNTIHYRVIGSGSEMQIDLQEPLVLDSVTQLGERLELRREGAAHFATITGEQPTGASGRVTAWYSGNPRVAPRPPWDGGVSWQVDSLGRPWVVTTDQGTGASVWWPNKDTQADEPDSMQVSVTVPHGLTQVGAGRLRPTIDVGSDVRTWRWSVTKPVNNYAIALNIGNYVHWREVFDGEGGELTMDFFPLDYHEAAARRQWVQARTTMQCFEHWFGPYPWYEDGYKLIEVPYPGMEHQSSVTYGNYFANGYRGRDGSGTGLGMKWDFIIVHESAHEWWGNNITTVDLADMWVHESFANYSENLYTECLFGKEAGEKYVIGTRDGIQNDVPVIPARGVNAKGSGDMYPKGGNMLHNIRRILDDDVKWREILRGLNREFRHQVVTGQQIQGFISREVGIDLSKVFEQYLTTTEIPELVVMLDPGHRPTRVLGYKWENVVDGFDMPVDVIFADGKRMRIQPSTEVTWLNTLWPGPFEVDPGFYVTKVERTLTEGETVVVPE